MQPDEKTYLDLGLDKLNKLADEIKLMLHASRDCLRNQGRDTSEMSYSVSDGYFGEAFGIVRGLVVLGYGYLGSSNVPNKRKPHWNLRWWFCELERKVLEEENFGGTNYCDHCLNRYGHDWGRILDRATGQIRVVRGPDWNKVTEVKESPLCR
jgi:hypothetical protein